MIKSRENPKNLIFGPCAYKKGSYKAIKPIQGRKNLLGKFHSSHFLPRIVKKLKKNKCKSPKNPKNLIFVIYAYKKSSYKAIKSILGLKKFFWKTSFQSFFTYNGPLVSCKKTEKINDRVSRKSKKTSFLGNFGPILAQKIFFSKIGLRHIRGFTVAHLCAKNQKKVMNQS